MALLSETNGAGALGDRHLHRVHRFRISGGKPLRPLIVTLAKKVKVKAVCGSYSTAALRHIVLLPK